MTSLKDKTALVTGASRGLGRATAERLAGEGAVVAVHFATNAGAAQEVVDGIRAAGGSAFPVQADFSRPGGRRNSGRNSTRRSRSSQAIPESTFW